MEGGLRTPMLDFFRRGEVARDVRMLAAQGAIAPRPMEQLGLLMILTRDHDTEVRQIAETTLQQLPAELVANFIARSDVPSELREFFAGRGIHPSDTPAPDFEEPLIDADQSGFGDATDEEKQKSFAERLATMTVPEKMKYAMKGTREMRAILIRDPNRLVASAVLSCPKVNEGEADAFAKMGNVSEDILRSIAQNRAWTKNYGVTLSLCKNPKTPIALTLNMMQRLTEADVKRLSTDRNVPEPVRIAARKRVVQSLK